MKKTKQKTSMTSKKIYGEMFDMAALKASRVKKPQPMKVRSVYKLKKK